MQRRKSVLARSWMLALLAIIAVGGLYLFYAYRIPPGVAPKGDANETIALIGLASAVVSMITAVVGLAQKLLELRKGESK